MRGTEKTEKQKIKERKMQTLVQNQAQRIAELDIFKQFNRWFSMLAFKYCVAELLTFCSKKKQI